MHTDIHVAQCRCVVRRKHTGRNVFFSKKYFLSLSGMKINKVLLSSQISTLNKLDYTLMFNILLLY